jgi:hypothetical protein
MAAVARYGRPLGPPAALPGGGTAQAFADIVLEAPGNGQAASAMTIAPAVLATGLLRVPRQATATQSPPSLPLGQYGSFEGVSGSLPSAEPTQVMPFVLTLAAALVCYGIVVAAVGTTLRRRRRRVVADSPRWNKADRADRAHRADKVTAS